MRSPLLRRAARESTVRGGGVGAAGTRGGHEGGGQLPPVDRFASVGLAYLSYLDLTIWPSGLRPKID